jgi:hypothetical protein
VRLFEPPWDNPGVSIARQQGFIGAPVEVVWDLLADVNRHPEWWPRVVAVQCEGLEEGCTYREVAETPFGRQELIPMIETRDECRELRIRCLNTGTFVRFALTAAREGTFLEGEMGMEPQSLGNRVFDVVAGKRYFRNWMEQTLEALDATACEQARA